MFGVSMPDKDEAHCSRNNKNKLLAPTLLSKISMFYSKYMEENNSLLTNKID
jgi:hypothetical protein